MACEREFFLWDWMRMWRVFWGELRALEDLKLATRELFRGEACESRLE